MRYLNVAVNNIARVENLQRCESLQRLDLTMNFIPLSQLASLASLSPNYNLRELHLLGNPCTAWRGWRPYVIAALTQLCKLVQAARPARNYCGEIIEVCSCQDGEEITAPERTAAATALPALEEELQQLSIAGAAEESTAGTEDPG